MSYQYIILPDAQEDFEEALQWYIERSGTAAENFVSAISTALSLICSYPNRWKNTYKDYYELGLKNTLM